MANAVDISDVGLVTLAQKAIIAARPALAKAKAFTLDLSNEAVAPSTTLKLAVYDSANASAFNASNNNYGTGDGSVSFASVTFSQYVKSYNFTDSQLAEIPVGLFDRAGEAAGVGLVGAVNGLIEGLFTSAGMTGTAIELASGTTASTITIRQLGEIVAAAKSDPAHCVLALDPAWFYQIIALFPNSVLGDPAAIRAGVLDGGVLGVKAIVPVKMPQGVVGAVCPEDAICIAFRGVPCASTTAYDAVINETADTGMPFQVRKYADPADGTNHVAGTVMVGAARVQGAKMQKIVVAS